MKLKRPFNDTSAQDAQPIAKRAKKAGSKRPRAIEFMKSEFMESQVVDPALVPLNPDLSNTIHPIFAQANFQAGVDYPAIEMALRLATHLLQAPALKPLLWTVISHKEPLDEMQTADDHGQHRSYRASDCATVFVDRHGHKERFIQDCLTELAGLMDFDVHTKADLAFTRLGRKRRRLPTYQGHFPKACESQVFYSRKLYNRLRTTHHAQTDAILLIALQFQLGVTLAHEVLHVLVDAVHGKIPNEPFMHGANVSEMGYEGEQRWFGGTLGLKFWKHASGRPVKRHSYRGQGGVRGRGSGLAGVFVLTRWPNRDIVQTYQAAGVYISVHDADAFDRSDLAWRVPFDWIARVMQQTFWDEVNDLSDPLTTTIAPKIVGQFFQTDAEGNLQDVGFEPDLCPEGYMKSVVSENVVRQTRKPKDMRGRKYNIVQTRTQAGPLRRSGRQLTG